MNYKLFPFVLLNDHVPVSVQLWSLNYAYFGIMICVLAYYSLKVRHVKQFTEAKCSFLSSFGILFIVLLMIVFAAVTDDVQDLVIINALAIGIALSEVSAFFWAPRIYAFHKHPEKRVRITEQQRRKQEESQYVPSFLERGQSASARKSENEIEKDEDGESYRKMKSKDPAMSLNIETPSNVNIEVSPGPEEQP